jgi:2-haloacid dehalogenase
VDTKTLARERFRRLLEHVGGDRRRAAALARAYLAGLSARGDLLPGTRALLRRLRRRFRLGVVTNSLERVQRGRLRASGLDGVFDVVVTSEACGYAKPDPRIIHVALDALAVRPRQALFVGDDLDVDGGAARAAGVAFCWIDRGAPRPPALRIPRRRARVLLELLTLLDAAPAMDA